MRLSLFTDLQILQRRAVRIRHLDTPFLLPWHVDTARPAAQKKIMHRTHFLPHRPPSEGAKRANRCEFDSLIRLSRRRSGRV
jgi:hypothetical protein